MTTKAEMIEIIKAENPNGLRSGNETDGYTDFTKAEYEAQIAEWADARLAKEAQLAEAELVAQAKLEAIDKLTALGIDPKAFGLQADEAKTK
jgi:hypothetical protein